MSRRSKIVLSFIPLVLILIAFGGAWLLLGHGARDGSSTTGQTVNAAIDNLKATGTRLLELPLILLLASSAVLAAALALPILCWGTLSGRLTLTRVTAAVVAGVALMSVALAVDRKFGDLQAEVTDLRGKLNQERMARLQAMNDADVATPVAAIPAPMTATPALAVAGSSVNAAQNIVTTAPAAPTPAATTQAAAAAGGKRTALMLDKDQVTRDLSALFGRANVFAVIHDQASDVVEVDMPSLPAIAYMAVVNLKTPGVEIKFGGSLAQKTLTSDFAKANNCQIAINGEAGASPQANSGLGVWRGNMISTGTVFMKEDPANRRPFLSFDQLSNVSFTAQAAASRAVPADAYNLIWGRMDAIIDGKVQTENERDRQPRTAMGISKDGGKLYLMVVDGRQQQYSIGFTRQEVGAFMQVFGANNGMLCDEGGSSCIYMKKFNGIANRPSDGVERPTYTHFGISLKAN